MQAESDLAGGTAQCPSCGQEFIVQASRPQIPVIQAQVDPAASALAPRNRPPASRGQVPMPRSGHDMQSHGHRGFRQDSAQRDERRGKILLASMLVGGASLITGMIWIGQKLRAPDEEKSVPKPSAAVAAAQKVKETTELELARLESERKLAEAETKIIVEKEKQEALKKEESNRAKIRHYYAVTIFEGDEEVAEEFIKEMENIQREVARVYNDGIPGNEPGTREQYEDFIMRRLLARMQSNPKISRWVGSRQPDALVQGLLQKGRKAPAENPASSLFGSGKYGSSGTGFWISADGWMLTNHHVVGDAKTVELRLSEREIIPCKVIKTDSENDLALLKAERTPTDWLPVSSGATELQLGQTVFTIGFPNAMIQGLEPKFTDGRVSSNTGLSDSKNSYQTTVPVQHGNSGGPMVDFGTGWVVGVMNARLENTRTGAAEDNVSYAIKGNVVRTFVDSVPEASSAVEAKHPLAMAKNDQKGIIERVKKSVTLVLQTR